MNEIELQIFGDLSLNGTFCDPQYYPGLKKNLEKLNELIGTPHLRVANWEAPISNSFEFNELKKPALATTLNSAELLIDNFNIDLLCLGNNHIGDCNTEGLKTTQEFFEKKSKPTYGAELEEKKVKIPKIIEIEGKKIGFLSFVGKETNPNIKNGETIYINFINELEVDEAISNLKLKTDFIVLTLHWGIEYNLFPNPKQRELARKWIDLGVNLIIGHHSHTLQGVETYKNGLIFYSLGNFIFSGLKGRETFGWPKFCNNSGLFKILIDSENKVTYRYIPLIINNEGFKIPTAEKEIKKLIKKFNSRSSYFDSNYYQSVFKINQLYTWFVRLPRYFIKVKGGIFAFISSYLNPSYFRLLSHYFK